MSSYADYAALIEYGLPEESLDGVLPEDVQAKLDAASTIADSYLGNHYTLPLVAPYPLSLTDAVCRIAAFNILATRGYNPNGDAGQVRLRYEDAIRWLEGVSAARVSIAGITDSSGSPSGSSGGPFVVSPGYDYDGNFTAGRPKPRGW